MSVYTAVRQRAGSFQVVPTRPVNPAHFSDILLNNDGSRAPDNMMNKDNFHNQLALNLGYQRLVKDKRINITVDDRQYPDDMLISISIDGFSRSICYKASEWLDQNDMDCLVDNGYDDIKMIVDAVHKAYIQATTIMF